MKLGGILFIIATLCLCLSAHAASIKDLSLKILPHEIEEAVRTSGISYDIVDCKLVGASLILAGDKPRSAYFVTVESKCLGSSAGRIFIVDVSGSKPSVIMKSAAYSVQSGKEKHNGLNDLEIFISNDDVTIEYWIFDSKKFVRDRKRGL